MRGSRVRHAPPDVPVVHCTAETRPDRRGANHNARLFLGVKKSPVQLAPGSAAVQVPAAIGVDPTDLVLPRYHGLGPMTGTQLDPILRNLGVTTIVGVGVSVNIGMTNLAFDAVNRGYQIVLPRDAIAGVPAEYAQAVVDNTLALVATLTTTDEILGRVVAAAPEALSLDTAAKASGPDVLTALGTGSDGLTAAEARRRLRNTARTRCAATARVRGRSSCASCAIRC